MTHDNAQFRPKDILAVWGERPIDPITDEWQNLDPAHILGRGYVSGAGPKTSSRSAFSSILNFYPLPRNTHAGGYRDHRYMRALLLEIAQERVQDAIREGRYEMRDEDAAFQELRLEWFEKNFPFDA